MTDTKTVQTPEEKAEIKQERAREAAKAMQDYQTERLATLARTAKLREERLAREAAEALQPKTLQPKTKPVTAKP